MLEIRPSCENCKKLLPNNSTEAMICSFECTFCSSCVDDILENVCPNCGGGFSQRPIRPKSQLMKYPVSDNVVHKQVDLEKFESVKQKYKNINPENR